MVCYALKEKAGDRWGGANPECLFFNRILLLGKLVLST